MGAAFKQLPEVARILGVTVDQCRYWLTLLGIVISHQGRVRVIPEDVVETLGKVAELVKTGIAPKSACMAVRSEVTEAQILPVNLPVTSSPIGEMVNFRGQLEEIKKVMLLMAEQSQKTQEEVKALRQENNALRAYLMPPPVTVKSITPWKYEPAKDPLEGMPWYRRAWVEYFEPWKMRRYAS